MLEEPNPSAPIQVNAQDYIKKCNHYICFKILQRILSFVDKTPALDTLEPTDRVVVKDDLFFRYRQICFQSQIRLLLERNRAEQEGRYFPDSEALNFKMENEDQDDQFEEDFSVEVSEVIKEHKERIQALQRDKIQEIKNQNEKLRVKIEENKKLLEIYTKENANLKSEKTLKERELQQANFELLISKPSNL